MGRFEAKDFGYTFSEKASAEEKEQLVAAAAADETETTAVAEDALAATITSDPAGGYSLYTDETPTPATEFCYQPTSKEKLRVRSGLDGADSDASAIPISAVAGALCCCLAISTVTGGAVLLAYENYKDDDVIVLIGILLFIVAGSSCLCGCCWMCLGNCTSSSSSSSSMGGILSQGDDNETELQIRFRRINDRYEKEIDVTAFQSKRLDVVGTIKEVQTALKKESQDKTKKELEHRKELEKHVKKDLEAGVSVQKVRQKYRPVVFVIVFNGDMMVSNMELLRKQVSQVVHLGQAGHDQCVVILTSPGE